MKQKNIQDELVSVKVRRKTLQNMKLIATNQAMTMVEWLEWTVDAAYKSQKFNKK